MALFVGAVIVFSCLVVIECSAQVETKLKSGFDGWMLEDSSISFVIELFLCLFVVKAASEQTLLVFVLFVVLGQD